MGKHSAWPFTALLVTLAIAATPLFATAASGKAGRAPTTPVMSTAYAETLRGGYVASGTGLRNRGAGTISVVGVPPEATVAQAYLFWSIFAGPAPEPTYANGVFNATSITGAAIGSGPSSVLGTTSGYAYRADVTAQVTGNGSYPLSGFATGQSNGADPFFAGSVAPIVDGASLVVVFAHARYPLTRVIVSNGYAVTNGEPQSATISWGFGASNPVGQVSTTFIGGDGESNSSEPPSTFNGHAVAAADWDGTDGPLPRYAYGNLWDTDTANVGRWVRPGNTSATVEVTGGPDWLNWVAQVLSIGVHGRADTDGDKLLDGWEANGYDFDKDGSVDVALPGASVVHKDIFVEMDYMGAEKKCPCHLPLAPDLERIRGVFASAPFADNPDGGTGIDLHLDAGPARGTKFDLGGGNRVPHDPVLEPVYDEFQAIKDKNFNPRRAKIYYYMVWAHAYGKDSSSGNAFGIPNDSFVVTLGRWPSHGSSNAKVGTFIHELGHDLGLFHGGNDESNYKPNYLSVMNYFFQVSGVPGADGNPPNFGYSSFVLPTLTEWKLNENLGLQSPFADPFRTEWWCPEHYVAISNGPANGPIDWNCDGVISGVVSANVNRDIRRTTLASRNDWATLEYGGGAVGADVGGNPPSARAPSRRIRAPMQELTYHPR